LRGGPIDAGDRVLELLENVESIATGHRRGCRLGARVGTLDGLAVAVCPREKGAELGPQVIHGALKRFGDLRVEALEVLGERHRSFLKGRGSTIITIRPGRAQGTATRGNSFADQHLDGRWRADGRRRPIARPPTVWYLERSGGSTVREKEAE